MEALPKDAHRIVSRWCRNEFYVYIRPVTSKLIDASQKHRTYWVVQVEYRTMPPGFWKGEGYSLAEVIRELDTQVPQRRAGSRIDQRDHPGLTAPAKAQKRAQARSKKRRETGQQPRKKKSRV